MFKADEGPLDMEDIVADHIGFTVSHQKLKTIHHLMDLLLMQHITNQPQVHVLCEKKDTELTQGCKDSLTDSYWHTQFYSSNGL